jgi:PAS domain S-box-containing protein
MGDMARDKAQFHQSQPAAPPIKASVKKPTTKPSQSTEVISPPTWWEIDNITTSMRDGLAILSHDREIMFLNEGAQTLLGFKVDVLGKSVEEVIGNFADYGFPDSTLKLFGDVQAALNEASEGKQVRFVFEIIKPGPNITVEAELGPYKDRSGKKLGILVTLRDQTLLYAERDKLRVIQESHGIGLTILDGSNRVIAVNSRFEEMNSYLPGKNYVEAIAELSKKGLIVTDVDIESVIERARGGKDVTFYCEANFENATSHIQLLASVINPDDPDEGIMITTRDVTSLVAKTVEANEMAKLAGKHSRELTSLAELSSFVGFRYDKIYDKYISTISELLKTGHVSIYLYQPGVQALKRVATSTNFNEHPEDWKLDSNHPVVESFLRRKSQIYTPDDDGGGETFDANLLAIPVTYQSKSLGAMVVSHRKTKFGSHDIRLMKLIAARLAVIIENGELYNEINSRRERWEAVFKFAEEGIVIFDKQGYIVGFNPAAGKLTGHKGGSDVIGKAFNEIIHTVSPEGVSLASSSPLRRVLNSGEVVAKRQQLLQTKSGQTVWTEISYSPIFDDEGVVTSGIAIISNVQKEREVEAVKSDFISIVSHELRTPLTAIKGFLSMLLQKDFGPLSDKQFHFLNRVYFTNQRMIHLVEDLLDASSIESGKIQLKKEPLAMEPIINDVINELASKGFERQILLKVARKQRLPLVLADEVRLRQILLNLVDNAIKYSLPKSDVVIEFHVQGNELVTSVRDQGVGITAAHIERLFQKFGRIYNPMSMQVGGSGIGLYIVKNLVESHDGRIWVTSREGKGSKFSFSLPIAKQLPLLP